MNHSLFGVAALAAVVLLATEPAQSKGEPEYVGNFAVRSGTSGDFVALERTKSEAQSRVKFMGFGGAEANMVVSGEHSPVRFEVGQSVQIIGRVSSQEVDPQTMIQFQKYKVTSGNRVMQVVRSRAFGATTSTANASAVAFNAAKFEKAFFLVTPAAALDPGEYCVSGLGALDRYCFGVDP